MSLFYDHLVGLEEVHNHLLDLNLPTKEHWELLEIIDSTINHEILNIILIELPKQHHEAFLIAFKKAPHDKKHLKFLKKHAPEIEDKISQVAIELKSRIIDNIHKKNH